MVFSSTFFIFCFLPAVLILYYIMPAKAKNILLLLASLIFYMWNKPSYIWLILLSITINYTGGLLIGCIEKKKMILVATVIANVALLTIFKYTDFIISTVNGIVRTDIPLTGIILPIGISFYTFQGLSYVIDVYRGTCKYSKNPINIALYISLFPQLVAGPIVKYKEIHTQISERKTSLDQFTEGVTRFITGLSKKVLIANILGETADKIFEAMPDGIDVITAWIGIICYTLQIYYDFSGYSDMAIGLGRMFGFEFPENFNYPYISKSITEFWRRWHISLSTWFKEYIYIPLGGSRTGILWLNLLITFFITGLWHGASLNFIVWGLWYGILLLIERPLFNTSFYKKIPKPICWLVTILIVMTGWVFFRAENLPAAIDYIKAMLYLGAVPVSKAHYSYMFYLDNRLIFTLAAGIICMVPLWKNMYDRYIKENVILYTLRNIILLVLLAVCLVCVINNVYNPFIYFQF